MTTFCNRTEITLNTLLNPNTQFIISTFSDYDALYRQETNQLCKFPEILKIMEKHPIEYADSWGFFRFKNLDSNQKKFKKKVKTIWSAFSPCKNLAVYMYGGSIEVRERPIYNNEDFITMRNRCCFEMRDYLDIKHEGYGPDSKMLPTPHAAEKFQLR
jgi:hypothetical protein